MVSAVSTQWAHIKWPKPKTNKLRWLQPLADAEGFAPWGLTESWNKVHNKCSDGKKIIGGRAQIILPPHGGKLYNFLEATKHSTGSIAIDAHTCIYTLEPKHRVCKRPSLRHSQYCKTRPESREISTLWYPPCTVKPGRSLCLVTQITHRRSFLLWDYSTFLCIGVQWPFGNFNYVSWKKKERNSLCKCPGEGDTRAVSPTALEITTGGGGGIQSVLTRGVL